MRLCPYITSVMQGLFGASLSSSSMHVSKSWQLEVKLKLKHWQ